MAARRDSQEEADYDTKRRSRRSIGSDWKTGERCPGSRCPDDVDMDQWMAQRSSELQELDLQPLKEDLSDWLNKTIGLDIECDKFLNELQTGVNLCKLAELVHISAERSGVKTRLPQSKPRFYAKAKPESWYARDNAASFMEWCKELGVKNECLFESDDLVFHKSPKAVVLCLLEVSRLVWKYGVEPPDIIKLEKELETDEEVDDVFDTPVSSRAEVNVIIENRASPVNTESDNLDGYCESVIQSDADKPDVVQVGSSEMVVSEDIQVGLENCVVTAIPDVISSASVGKTHVTPPEKTGESRDKSKVVKSDSSKPVPPTSAKLTAQQREARIKERIAKAAQVKQVDVVIEKPADLDAEVSRISIRMQCQGHVERIKEGRYRIFGKEIFIRVLKQKHLMVRVGGGWQVLEHYLIRRQTAYQQRQSTA
ncbi:hypothetical protein ScPMuIL_013026 [Solemya velum]